MSDRLAWFLVGAVVFVWVATTIVLPLVVPNYTSPPGVTSVMGSLAGGAAAYLFAKRGERDEENKPKSKRKPPRRGR